MFPAVFRFRAHSRRPLSIPLLIAAVVQVALTVAPAAAGTPKVCTGLPIEDSPALAGKYLPCPPNHAIYGSDDAGGEHKSGPGRHVPIVAACCPLPSDDILTPEHLYGVMESCPEGYIVTGATLPQCTDLCEMRCTRINSARYRLGEEQSGAHWSTIGGLVSGGFGGARRLLLSDVPPEIRRGLQRRSARMFDPSDTDTDRRRADEDGCVGVPFGSVLVAKTGKNCDMLRFRQLQMLDGTPVRMFPNCEATQIAPGEAAECAKLNEPESDGALKIPSVIK